MRETYSKLTTKTPDQLQLRSHGFLIVNFEQIIQIVLAFPFLHLNKLNLRGLENKV